MLINNIHTYILNTITLMNYSISRKLPLCILCLKKRFQTIKFKK